VSESEFERGVHAEIARFARNIHNDVTADELLCEVTETSVRLLPDVDYAGVTLVDGRHRRLRSTAATGAVPNRLDRLQEQHQQGPAWMPSGNTTPCGLRATSSAKPRASLWSVTT